MFSSQISNGLATASQLLRLRAGPHWGGQDTGLDVI